MIRLEVQSEIDATRDAMAGLRRAIEARGSGAASPPVRGLQAQLVAMAEAYAEHRGLKLSTVSTYAAGDGKFLGSLKGSAGCTIRRANRLVEWFDEHWPDDLDWPSDIPRPSADTEGAA